MAKKKMIIPRIDIPIMEANGNMSMAWYLFLSYLLSKSGEGGGGSPASDARITLMKDGHEIGHFTLNQESDAVVDFTATDAVLEVNGQDGCVVLTADDVGALPDTTKYGYSVDLAIDSTTYAITATLKDQDGNVLNTSEAIDLPLESVVVGGRYDSATKKLIFTLQNGTTFDVPVGDLIAGLQTEITSTNKLSADLVDDSSTTHKFVSASEKSTWNAKQEAISDLSTIRSNASAGAGAAQTIATYGDIVTHNVAEFQAALTTAQLAAINSTITAQKVSIYDGYAAQIAAKQDTISDLATIRAGAAAGATALQPNAPITPGTATKVTYDATGRITGASALLASDIPDLSATYYSTSNPNGYQVNVLESVKVNGNTLPITNKSVSITMPTKVSDLTNDTGFITGITSSMVITALGYTPYSSANPNGYQANVIESVKVNGTALSITGKAVNVPVPTKVSDLTNDTGYITGISSSMVITALGYTPVNPTSLATVATSGSYNDLTNKPTIPAAQVNSDWNATTGVAKILNKPTLGTAAAANTTDFATAAQGAKADTAIQPGDLATVATTGQYSDLSGKPTIPTVNNPTITFMQGSTLVGTMTLNQQGAQTFTFAAGGSGSFSPDNTTITTVGGEAKVIAVKNQNTASGAIGQIKMWDGSGTEYKAQREAQTLDNNTLCVVKNVSNGADFGSITEEADIGADWGSVTESPGPVTNMALHIGDYVLGTEQDIY